LRPNDDALSNIHFSVNNTEKHDFCIRLSACKPNKMTAIAGINIFRTIIYSALDADLLQTCTINARISRVYIRKVPYMFALYADYPPFRPIRILGPAETAPCELLRQRQLADPNS
jgi:hypothetical protein